MQYESLPGFFFISAISSPSDAAASVGLVISTLGVVTASVIGAKSRTGL